MKIERFFEGLTHFDSRAHQFIIRPLPQSIQENTQRLENDPQVESDLYSICQDFKNMMHNSKQKRYAESYFDDSFQEIICENSINFFNNTELSMFSQRCATKVTNFLVHALEVENFNNQQREMIILAARRSLLKGLEYVDDSNKPRYNRIVSSIYMELIKQTIDMEQITHLLGHYELPIDQVVNSE